MPEREVVIPVLAGIGNSVMAVPLVRQLRRAFPGVKISVAARTRAIGEVFERLDEVDEVLRLGPTVRAALATQREIRRRRPDVYLIPHPSARWHYKLLAASSGSRWSVMHRYPSGSIRGLGRLPMRGVVRLPADRRLHDTVQLVNMIAAFGVRPDIDEPPYFPLADADHAAAEALLADIGMSGPYVAVMPGCARTVLGRYKRWPPARFARVVEWLLEEHGLRSLVLEGPDERGLGEQVRAALPPARRQAAVVAQLRGNLGIAGALLRRARLFVGNDSAIGHIAAAVGTVPVTIFGAGDPVRGHPFGYRELAVTPYRDWTTPLLYPFDSPFPKLRDDGVRWVELIPVEAVIEATRRAMAFTPVPPRDLAADPPASRA